MSKVSTISSLLTLPTEVTVKILHNLDPEDVVVCSMVRQPNSLIMFTVTESNRSIYPGLYAAPRTGDG